MDKATAKRAIRKCVAVRANAMVNGEESIGEGDSLMFVLAVQRISAALDITPEECMDRIERAATKVVVAYLEDRQRSIVAGN